VQFLPWTPFLEEHVRLPQKVPGRYYVDSTCVDCDLCRNTAPNLFRGDEETGFSFVYCQPVTLEEIALAEEAKQGCPTESIGNDGLMESVTCASGPKAEIERSEILKAPVPPAATGRVS
jgi:ferredoxin